MPRIDIDIAAEDQADGELVARLITAALTSSDFDDVTSITHNTHQESSEEVLSAMRNLNPSIFATEITIGVTVFEEDVPVTDAASGDSEFPDPDADNDADPED